MSGAAGSARPSPPPLPSFLDATPAKPLAGVTSAVLTAAVRRVEERWQDLGSPALAENDPTLGPRLLAALALAVAHGVPGYLSELVPQPSVPLCRRLIDWLRVELLNRRGNGAPPATPAEVLRLLLNLETVRQAIEAEGAQDIEAYLAGSEGLELLVGVLHDLRSPLTSILFLAEGMQQGRSGSVSDLQRRQLGLVYSAALGLSSLASDALELSRGGDQLADGGLSPLSVIELFESVRDIVRPMAEEKGLEIIIVVPTVQHRLGHPVALSRTLLNLTTNALKFTEEGFVEIRATELDATRVEFAVRDTGPGINQTALKSLYQPLRRRGERHGFSLSSTGLGLAICRKLVGAMGAELRLQSRPGWGTRFSFELDLPPVHPVEGSTP